jgi:electron transfer DM13
MSTNSCSTNMAQQNIEPATSARSRSRRGLISAVVIGVAAVGWYLFRPELLYIDHNVNEAFPAAGASSMSLGEAKVRGMFHSGAHETKGTAAIYEITGGKRVLRLTGFATSNGPDVHVLLGKAADATDNDTVKTAGYVDLGSMKGNIGDQNYEIPADANLTDFGSVTIWCNRFNVNFGTAPLIGVGAAETKMDAAKSLASGSFHSVAHETKGTATVHELPGSVHLLRLTNFATSNGPDVHVFLGKATDATDNDTVNTAGYVDLGSLKGNIGDQNYTIPTNVNPAEYKSVTIWCNRFSVNFGTAPLTMN